MAKNRLELQTHIRDLRANFVKRYLSLGLNDAHRPNLDLDLDGIRHLKEEDSANTHIWDAFLHYFELIGSTNESYEDYSLYRDVIDLLKNLEEDQPIESDKAVALLDSLTRDSYAAESDSSSKTITSDEVSEDIISQNEEPTTPSTHSDYQSTNQFFTINSSDLIDATDLKTLVLNLDSGSVSIADLSDHHQLIDRYVSHLDKLNIKNAYQYFVDAIKNDDPQQLYATIIKLADLYDTLALELPIDLSLQFKELYPNLFLTQAYASFYDALLATYEGIDKNPTTLNRRSTQRKLHSLYSVLKVQALYSIDDSLIERIERDELNDPQLTLTLLSDLLHSINEEQELFVTDHNITEHSPLESTDIDLKSSETEIEKNESYSQLSIPESKEKPARHPYYLDGFLETPLREKPDYDDDLLHELKESYFEEVNEEIFPTIDGAMDLLQTEPYDKEAVLNLRRAFHTLKGSGYMAGYMIEGEIAWQVEQVLNGCRDGHYEFNEAIWHHAMDGYRAIKSLLNDQSIANNELERIAYQANYLLENRGIIEADTSYIPLDEEILSDKPAEGGSDAVDETAFTNVVEPSADMITSDEPSRPHPYYLEGNLAVELKEAPGYDEELLAELKESYLDEVNDEVFPLLTEALDELSKEPYDQEQILNLRRAFHTLKGSGYMAGFMIAGEIAWQIEQVLNGCRDGNYDFNKAIWHHANDGYQAIDSLLTLKDDSTGMPQLERIAYQANYLLENQGIIAPQTENIQDVDTDLQVKADTIEDTVVESPTEEDLEPISIQDALADADLSSSVESDQSTGDIDTETTDTIRTAQYNLEQMQTPLNQINALFERLSSGSYHDLSEFAKLCGELTNASPMPQSMIEQQLIEALQYSALMHRAHGISPRENMLTLWNSVLASIQEIIEQKDDIDRDVANAQIINLKQPIITYAQKEDKTESSQAEDEIYELFSAEAVEILELSDELINDWQAEGYDENSELIAEFRRHMHTLKGSARMVGKTDIGQLAHAMESLLDPLYINRFSSDSKQFDLLQRTLDHLPLMLESKESALGQEGYNLLSALHLLLGNETPPELDDKGNIAGDKTHTDVTEKTSEAAQAELSAIRVSPISLANISEDIAENIILDTQQNRNLMQINTTIEELERTISRVNAQTRRIEIEMEAQMLSRHARLIEDDDFDPLELDRFTELQQITRFISESVADLNSLCENIQEQTEDLDINLEKQKALHEFINHSLNEIRTVSFLSIVPRLRRLIRQVSKEHDKKVELIAKGVDIQAERSIVEQIIPPFEHMIRNSIIHGLEDSAHRDQSNKPETGKITLEVIKEEAELLIRFSDDGQGINIEKVRERLIDMGEIEPEANLTDQEIVNMLMLPGMSTAGNVSQDAGRGVGLDVLAKASLLLNADISIINNPGKGLTFEIRIPFSLSTINALIVRASEKFYAIPINHIIAVERHSSRDDENNILYQDQKYHIYNLTNIYRDVSIFSKESQNSTYLLLNIDGKRFALEIDEIMAHQEIIMRPLNPQIARTPGLTGASILSTGEIVYIIDVAKLFSSVLVEQQGDGIDIDRLSSEFLEEATRDRTPTILIVDDSITMRRVSSRLVERLGLQHETAKDGLDAIEKIEQNIPDLIMLDIEMPNMDGFEVLNYLRTDEHYSQIPIIMITSRIGEKHKERALELGADMYCGKPYSEDEMTDNIKTLLGDKWDNIQ